LALKNVSTVLPVVLNVIPLYTVLAPSAENTLIGAMLLDMTDELVLTSLVLVDTTDLCEDMC
jgi:hypothetical protein